MSRTETIKKLIPNDKIGANYLDELCDYHQGIEDFVEYFYHHTNINDLKKILIFLKKEFKYLLNIHSQVQNKQEQAISPAISDYILVNGIYTLLNCYINNGQFENKFVAFIEKMQLNPNVYLQILAKKYKGSYYYDKITKDSLSTRTDITINTDEYIEKIYVDFIYIQKMVSNFNETTLNSYNKNLCTKFDISLYEPELYKNTNASFIKKYYDVHLSRGHIVHKTSIINIAKNQIIEIPNKYLKILKKIIKHERFMSIIKIQSAIDYLYDSGLISNVSLIKDLDDLYNRRKTFKGSIGILHIELTHQCNLNCENCFNRLEKREQLVSYERYIEILNGFAKIGKFYTILFGGEPLMYKQIGDIIKHLNSINFPIEIFTNGTLIDHKFIDLLKNYKVNKLKISLDGCGEYNDSIRGQGTYDKIIQAIKLVKNHTDTFVTVSTTLSKSNIENIEELIKTCKEIGVDSMGFSPVSLIGNAKKNCVVPLTVNEQIVYADKIKMFLQKYGINGILENFRDKPSGVFRRNKEEVLIRATPCDIGVGMFYLRSDGLLSPCPDLTNPEFSVVIHKVEDTDNFFSEKINKLRYPCEVCSKCHYFYYCYGSCKASIYDKYGTMEKCDLDYKRKCSNMFDNILMDNN